MKQLLIGCGNSRDRRIATPLSDSAIFEDLATIDVDPACKPDEVWDLNQFPWPVPGDFFDEVHAYEILEHLGHQGNIREFFACFDEVYRVLKPGGYLCATCPSAASQWAWGDPGHTRIVSAASLTFLDRTEYVRQVGHTPMTDYRWLYKSDFSPQMLRDNGDSFQFVLQAEKPAR